jgi:hypothetical protein
LRRMEAIMKMNIKWVVNHRQICATLFLWLY